jgi:hypothetical protein
MVENDEHLIFTHLSLLGLELDTKEYHSFKDYIFSKKMLKRFKLQSLVGLFIVDTEKMQFKLVERTKPNEVVSLLTDVEIEFEIILIFKMAVKMGFEIFFENKFSN